MSHHTAELVVASGIDARKVEVVPVPIDTARFSPGDRDRRGILFVGRAHDPRKGFSRLVALLARSPMVRRRGLHVVSPGPRPDALPDSITPAVTWWGTVTELSERYRASELLVLPSYQEGLGIVAFEALACGTPVVAYRCGGPDRFLEESGGGVVADDDLEFAQQVEALLADRGRREEMGAAGRAWVERHMSTDIFLHDSALFAV